jgi:O-antigen/teichoic acid export membrane protein
VAGAKLDEPANVDELKESARMGDIPTSTEVLEETYPALANAEAPSRAKTILVNFGSLSAGAAVSRVAGLATNAVLARTIAASGFGVAGIAQAVTSYFSLLSDMGLGTVAIREGAQNRSKLQQVISATIGLRLAIAFALIPIGLITAQFLPYSESAKDLFRIYLLTLPLQALSVDCFFRSLQKMYLNTALQIFGALLTLVLTIALVRQAKDLIWVAGVAAIAAASGAVFGVELLRRQGYSAWPAFSLRESGYLLRQSLPLCAVSFAVTMYAQTNNLILGAYRSEAEVGLYVAATKLIQVCYYPIWLYFTAMIPALMEAWAVSWESTRSLLSTSVRITGIVSIGSGLIAVSLSQWAIRTLFGRSFDGASSAFNILVWTGVIVAIGHNWDQLCVAARRNRILLQSTLLGAFANLVVCGLTVSHIGIRGAALGNMMAEAAAHAYLLYSFGWQMGLSVLREAIKPAIAGAGAYGVMLATWNSGPPLCPVFTASSYAAFLLMIGGITASDFNRVRTLIPSRKVLPDLFS